MSSQGQEPCALEGADGEVLRREPQSGLIIVPFSEAGLSSMVWGKMMERLLSGGSAPKKPGVIITGTRSAAERVQLVETASESELRLLPPHPQETGEEEREPDGEQWVSIHIPLERLEGMALGAGRRPRRSWLGPALASAIVLSGLILGAAGARTFPRATAPATAAPAERGQEEPRPPVRPSVVVVKKNTQPPSRHANAKPAGRAAPARARARRVDRKRRRRVRRARRHLRVARYALRKGRRRLAKRRAVLALRLDPGNRAARWILSRVQRPRRPKPARAPRFIGERRGSQPVVW